MNNPARLFANHQGGAALHRELARLATPPAAQPFVLVRGLRPLSPSPCGCG